MKLIFNNKIIATVMPEDTFFKKALGLMFKKNIAKNTAYFFPDSSSIHTFFMRFPIDVIYLSRNSLEFRDLKQTKENCVYTGRIVKIVQCLKPYRFSGSLKADSLLELKAPSQLLKNLQINDILKIAND